MMQASDHLTDDVLRTRLMDLTFSLYESLGDFLSDFVWLDGTDATDDLISECYSRLNKASMNCLADIDLLQPILRSIRMSLNGPFD